MKLLEELTEEAEAAWAEFTEYRDSATTEEAAEELSKTAKFKTLLAKSRALRAEARAVLADPIERGDHVWLFRRK